MSVVYIQYKYIMSVIINCHANMFANFRNNSEHFLCSKQSIFFRSFVTTSQRKKLELLKSIKKTLYITSGFSYLRLLVKTRGFRQSDEMLKSETLLKLY